ncbi:DMT family transporter [Reyranella aquatilis]|uniref:DMT family transporter n=1 Tax=Reyranella aquatilis TaxID=2035356 RepID=A0ABS8KMX9_9HYPH|nr:DMT family transporter [Reyranella aquatilis]MCC8427400.1 DMT family transporter [Reyranella aquatilis]
MSDAPRQTALHGIYFKLSALVLFCTMDAMVKGLGGTYGSFQLMVFRSGVALVPVAVMIWHAGGMRVVRSNRPWLQALRVTIGFGSMFGFFYAFPRMPLVDAYAISFSAPLFMVALSVLILKEPVGWRRWTAVGVGFAGVLIMLDPWGIEFHTVSLIILAATFCYSLSTVMVRLLSRHDPDVVTLFWFAIVGTVISLACAIPEWIWPPPMDWVWLLTLGLLGGFAQILITRAWRLAPAAVLAPFDYVSIILAVAFGYLWFREEPSWTVWYGLPLVVGSGLYILHRERVRARERSKSLIP